MKKELVPSKKSNSVISFKIVKKNRKLDEEGKVLQATFLLGDISFKRITGT